VILRLGREGVTWNSSRNSTTRNQISAPRNSHRNQHHPSRKRNLPRIFFFISAQNEEKIRDIHEDTLGA
jgi:hypothetical protein